jgi:hypothetical protein
VGGRAILSGFYSGSCGVRGGLGVRAVRGGEDVDKELDLRDEAGGGIDDPRVLPDEIDGYHCGGFIGGTMSVSSQ